MLHDNTKTVQFGKHESLHLTKLNNDFLDSVIVIEVHEICLERVILQDLDLS